MTGLVAAAFAAGMVSTVNPCGFAMLPAYLGLILGDRGSGRRSALAVGVAVSSGFVIVFVVSGIMIASGLRAIVSWIPWLAAVVGLGLIAAGVAQLRGAHLFALLPVVKRASRSRSIAGLIGFGVSYGVASLACTLPIFLSLIAGSLAAGSFAGSAAVFAAYGAGMSLVMVAVTLGLAAGRDRGLPRLRSVGSRLGAVSGWIMMAAGGFIFWYWATVLVEGPAEPGSSPVVRFIENVSADIAGFVAAHQLVAGFIALALGLVGWTLTRRPKNEGDDRTPTQSEPTLRDSVM